MRSIWMQILLLLIYLLLVFFVSRILDLVLWYHHGIPSTQIVDPLLLSVRQLKNLLENRGVSYTGYVEKKELAQLVEAAAHVVQGEVEELSHSSSVFEADGSGRERIPTPPPPSRFTGRLHFYEEVEDTKDSVWLVQVVPAGKKQVEPLLDDYSWRVVCNQVAPFAIRTGVFDCKLDRRLCSSKGWDQPLLLLALPKGTRAKDRVILRTFTSTRAQPIVDWVHEQLSIRVKTVENVTELECDWLGESSPSCSNTTSPEVKVILLSHLLHPPLFLAALSIKFTGRIKFGMFTVKKHEKLKNVDHKIPSYLIITPERKVIYGQRKLEHFNFDSMNRYLRGVQPEMNDVFLCSLIVANMLVTLQIFQVSMHLWWKHVARCLWTLVSYNFWLFAIWLLILATNRFPVVNFMLDKCLVLVRFISLSEFGSLVRTDWQILSRHPYVLLVSFLLYTVIAVWLLKKSSPEETEIEIEPDRPWWEVLPVDSYWINCFFRPMATLTRPLPPSELELEEGIEMLIERLAVPNLWLQPVIPNEYIKDLPVWKFRGWDSPISKPECAHAIQVVHCDSPESIERLMDGEEAWREQPRQCEVCHCCTSGRVKYRHLQSSLCCHKKKTDGEVKCKHLPCKTFDSVKNQSEYVGRMCCVCFNAEDKNQRCSKLLQTSKYCAHSTKSMRPCSASLNKRAHNDVSCNEQVSDCEILSCEWSSRNVKDSSSFSEDSGDESSHPPIGMLPTFECAVCLEAYTWGSLLCGLPCGHSYHQCCIMVWLQRDNHHCPVCRWPAYKSKHSLSHLHRE